MEAAVSEDRLLTRATTPLPLLPQQLPAQQTSPCALPDTHECLYCVDVKGNLSTHSTHPIFYSCSLFLFIVLFSVCHSVYSRSQGFSCPAPLLLFVWVFIHACFCFLGVLQCVLHALLAGLLIKLCLQAISHECVQMNSL